ncbi:hypothetical protein SARC_11086 [Sphaeroforma arctica JP610]|uniref:PEST proteolytic signal-containing nuclear protein n=1 Tax=Sphaeroforma arctica JP610 TaxID=667725 RepID=A0A0L0FHY8_9EUKA|nr:hypothetical protein SARC_11086 [Sphaeroforma arctica JP610]KNC76407.1 hypothetical protein SARC_11086 [Sphaeroforma arctica JP610]|eukprot:XP_014150309.1 hypothetical protein SARC_11086 [Sphaeroforma arctica JP610]
MSDSQQSRIQLSAEATHSSGHDRNDRGVEQHIPSEDREKHCDSLTSKNDTHTHRKMISLKPITKPAINFKLGGGGKLGGAGNRVSLTNGLKLVPNKMTTSYTTKLAPNSSTYTSTNDSTGTSIRTGGGLSVNRIGGILKKPNVISKVKPGSVFGGTGESDSEEEEMPMEAKMRMRNVGKDTVTSAGPNSFYKTKKGFTDPKSIWKASEDKLASQHMPGDDTDE